MKSRPQVWVSTAIQRCVVVRIYPALWRRRRVGFAEPNAMALPGRVATPMNTAFRWRANHTFVCQQEMAKRAAAVKTLLIVRQERFVWLREGIIARIVTSAATKALRAPKIRPALNCQDFLIAILWTLEQRAMVTMVTMVTMVMGTIRGAGTMTQNHRGMTNAIWCAVISTARMVKVASKMKMPMGTAYAKTERMETWARAVFVRKTRIATEGYA